MKKNIFVSLALLVLVLFCISTTIAVAADPVKVCGGFYVGMSLEDAKKLAEELKAEKITQDVAQDGKIINNFLGITDPVTNRKVDVHCFQNNNSSSIVVILVAFHQYDNSFFPAYLIPDYETACNAISSQVGKQGEVEDQFDNDKIRNQYSGKHDQAIIDGKCWRYTTWVTPSELIQVYINNEPYTTWKWFDKDQPQIQIAIGSSSVAQS